MIVSQDKNRKLWPQTNFWFLSTSLGQTLILKDDLRNYNTKKLFFFKIFFLQPDHHFPSKFQKIFGRICLCFPYNSIAYSLFLCCYIKITHNLCYNQSYRSAWQVLNFIQPISTASLGQNNSILILLPPLEAAKLWTNTHVQYFFFTTKHTRRKNLN